MRHEQSGPVNICLISLVGINARTFASFSPQNEISMAGTRTFCIYKVGQDEKLIWNQSSTSAQQVLKVPPRLVTQQKPADRNGDTTEDILECTERLSPQTLPIGTQQQSLTCVNGTLCNGPCQ